MNTANTFHSDDFDTAFTTRSPRKPALVTIVVDDDTDDDPAGVDLDFTDDDLFGETDLEILEAIVAAANR